MLTYHHGEQLPQELPPLTRSTLHCQAIPAAKNFEAAKTSSSEILSEMRESSPRHSPDFQNSVDAASIEQMLTQKRFSHSYWASGIKTHKQLKNWTREPSSYSTAVVLRIEIDEHHSSGDTVLWHILLTANTLYLMFMQAQATIFEPPLWPILYGYSSQK